MTAAWGKASALGWLKHQKLVINTRIEHLTDEEIDELRSRCEARAKTECDRAVRHIDKAAQVAVESAG
jgi:low affinity Fe/Cu permease